MICLLFGLKFCRIGLRYCLDCPFFLWSRWCVARILRFLEHIFSIILWGHCIRQSAKAAARCADRLLFWANSQHPTSKTWSSSKTDSTHRQTRFNLHKSCPTSLQYSHLAAPCAYPSFAPSFCNASFALFDLALNRILCLWFGIVLAYPQFWHMLTCHFWIRRIFSWSFSCAMRSAPPVGHLWYLALRRGGCSFRNLFWQRRCHNY